MSPTCGTTGMPNFLLMMLTVRNSLTPATRTASTWMKPAPSLTMGLLIGVAILLVEAVRPDGVAPFIYFQF